MRTGLRSRLNLVLLGVGLSLLVSCEGCARCPSGVPADASKQPPPAAIAVSIAAQPDRPAVDAGSGSDWLSSRIKAALHNPRGPQAQLGRRVRNKRGDMRHREVTTTDLPAADEEAPVLAPAALSPFAAAEPNPATPAHNTQLEHRLGIELAGIDQQLQQVELLHRKLEESAQQGDLGDKLRQELAALSQDLRTLRQAQGALQAQLQRLRAGR